jgi:hypothetical protein
MLLSVRQELVKANVAITLVVITIQARYIPGCLNLNVR